MPRSSLCSALLPPLVAAPAWAQQGSYLRPSLVYTEIYDDYLLGNAEEQVGMYARVGPHVEAGYQAVRWALAAAYLVEAEILHQRPGLDPPLGQQRSMVEVSARATPRLSCTGEASHWDTHSADRLSGPLAPLGGNRWRGYSLAAGASLDVGPVTRSTLDHAFTRQESAGVRSDSVEVTAAIEHRINARDTAVLAGVARRFSFDPGVAESSAALLAGWSRALSPRLQVTTSAGPSVTLNHGGPALDAEASGLVAYSRGATVATAEYRRRQSALAGVSGATDTNALALQWRHRIAGQIEVSAASTLWHAVGGEATLRVAEIHAGAGFSVSAGVSLFAAAQLGWQQGQGTSGEVSPVMRQHRFFMGVRLGVEPEARHQEASHEHGRTD